MNVRQHVEHEVSITKTLRGFHFVKVVGATPWLCQWHGLQDMTEASSFHQLRPQVDSLGHVYMVAGCSTEMSCLAYQFSQADERDGYDMSRPCACISQNCGRCKTNGTDLSDKPDV